MLHCFGTYFFQAVNNGLCYLILYMAHVFTILFFSVVLELLRNQFPDPASKPIRSTDMRDIYLKHSAVVLSYTFSVLFLIEKVRYRYPESVIQIAATSCPLSRGDAQRLESR
jgi:hypothetical protein